jgi:hypothetical protein
VALLAGALAADLFTALPEAPVVAVLQAAAAVALAVVLTRPSRWLALALLPAALVWAGPHLLGSDVVGGHPEITVIE